MSTLTKSDLAAAVARKTGITASLSHEVVQVIIDEIQATLVTGCKVELRGFGTFKVAMRKARIGHNPQHPEAGPLQIPAKTVVRFSPGAILADAVNHPTGDPAPAVAA